MVASLLVALTFAHSPLWGSASLVHRKIHTVGACAAHSFLEGNNEMPRALAKQLGKIQKDDEPDANMEIDVNQNWFVKKGNSVNDQFFLVSLALSRSRI